LSFLIVNKRELVDLGENFVKEFLIGVELALAYFFMVPQDVDQASPYYLHEMNWFYWV
jgi:hypothetical protein